MSGWYPHKNSLLNSLSTQTHILMRSLHAHARSEREKERAVMLSSDIYLSNPISPDPYLPSPPPTVLQERPCSCTFVEVKRAEVGKRRERKRWMAGEVSLMCAGPLTLSDRDLTKP